ncbi:MAG: glycosyl transferase [Methylothermaceae bacteria B42]|nr:MAG: glycosyl transferase [Methylothermaceae bacteria B42]HHJ40427.1 glycosyltransferase family 4 protein [Methylothermaceae bacterium]
MKNGLLVITELFLPTKGGTAVWFDEVYRRLGKEEIHIVTSYIPGCEEYDKKHPNRIYRIKLKRHAWLKPESLLMYIKLLIYGLNIIIQNNIKEIHAGRVLPEGFVGLLLARMFRKKLLVYAHGEEITTWIQPLKNRFMRFVYSNSDKIIVNSEFTKKELLKLGVLSDKVSLISPGVDVNRFRKKLNNKNLRKKIEVPESASLLLSVGRLSRRKGFDMVIRALPELIQEGVDAYYVIIGIGEDYDYLNKIIRELDLENRVFLLGHVPMDDLPYWYNECDLFVMPNREINGDNEGFGMVFIEAAACGKTAIAGKAGGTGSAVIDGVTGLRVNGESPRDIAESISKLLKDKEYLKKLENAAYIRVMKEFAWEKVAEKTKLLMD